MLDADQYAVGLMAYVVLVLKVSFSFWRLYDCTWADTLGLSNYAVAGLGSINFYDWCQRQFFLSRTLVENLKRIAVI